MDPNGVVTFDDIDGYKVLVFCKDALSANLNVEGAVKDLALLSAGRPGEFTVFASNCIAHQCVLGLKSSLVHFEGLPSFLVRHGNLWSVGKFAARFQDKLRALSKQGKFRQVLHLPDGADRWRRRAKRVLGDTRPTGDLSLQEEAFCLDFDNSDWDGADLVHWHLPDCACGGVAKKEENWYRTLSSLHGRGCPQCLLKE